MSNNEMIQISKERIGILYEAALRKTSTAFAKVLAKFEREIVFSENLALYHGHPDEFFVDL